MARWRLSIRAMMGLVLGLGVALHLGITARRVHRGSGDLRNLHVHSAIMEIDDSPAWFRTLKAPPFWPSYGRALLGRTWQDWPLDRPLCQAGEGLLEEWCELAHPGVRKDVDSNRNSALHTKEQKDLFIRLTRAKGRDVGYDRKGNIAHRMPDRRKKADSPPGNLR